MTREEQLKCIADTCDAFKQAMLAKGVKDSRQLGRNRNPAMGDGFREGRMGIQDDAGPRAAISGDATSLRLIAARCR